MAANDHSPLPRSSTAQLSLGLRWLESDPDAGDRTSDVQVRSWEQFLALGERFAPPDRLKWARLWPWWGLVNGVLAMTGLMVWPEQSGVHLLIFLMAFWALPLSMWLWTAVAGLFPGRAPWWRMLITRHDDLVISCWCLRQSLMGQVMFVLSGLVWLWAMLATRQIIFYWGTSIDAVSQRVEALLTLISAGLLQAPSQEAVTNAEAGFVTGWRTALLGDSLAWAQWLTQALGLWVLLPAIVLLVLCQIRLRWALARWPLLNQRLRERYERCSSPALHYRALQPEQPVTEGPRPPFRVIRQVPGEPVFAWQLTDPELPRGSIVLGEAGFAEDQSRVTRYAADRQYWIIAADTVPTGDLADLLALHRQQGGEPRLVVLLSGRSDEEVETLSHTWGVFLRRNNLEIPLELVSATKETPGHE